MMLDSSGSVQNGRLSMALLGALVVALALLPNLVSRVAVGCTFLLVWVFYVSGVSHSQPPPE